MFGTFKKLVVAASLAASMAVFGGTAQATIIDFTAASPFGNISGVTAASATIQGIQVDVTSTGGNLNSTQGFDNAAAQTAVQSFGLEGTFDGFGINDDEVSTGNESLNVSFSPSVEIISVFLIDLFSGETAVLSTSGNFAGSNANGGFLQVILNATVATIDFSAIGSGSDFAVAGFEVTPVPLPAALPLFAAGLGLIGLLGWRRKRATA